MLNTKMKAYQVWEVVEEENNGIKEEVAKKQIGVACGANLLEAYIQASENFPGKNIALLSVTILE